MSPALAGGFFTTEPPGKPGRTDERGSVRRLLWFLAEADNSLVYSDESGDEEKRSGLEDV